MSRVVSLVAGAVALGVVALGGALPAQAADFIAPPMIDSPWAGTKWLVRGRVIGMLPDENDGRLAGGPASYDVEDAVMPELDFTYFLTDNLAAELILAATPHDVDLAGAGKITELWVLPPTLTLQYHLPMGAFKSYAGVGVTYITILDSDATGALTFDNWDDAVGIAFQVGFDYAMNDKWSLNVDLKKILINLDATTSAGAASVDLDPWVVGVGLGYRF